MSVLKIARASLQQSLSWYGGSRRHWNYPPHQDLQNAVKDDLRSLRGALEKLEQQLFKIATFGLVSRGKSTVINALLGKDILETGALHGVTKWPKSIRWQTAKIAIELIDTPGLDEIDGEARALMAKEVAQEADLILFVVAGDITRTEYSALLELRRYHKPLLLVFNKIDLYPEIDQKSIYQQLQQLSNDTQQPLFTPDEVIMVAAQPQPLPVRIELPDGSIKEEWENLPPQIDSLRQKILDLLNQDGKNLLALNALVQGKKAQENIARKTIAMRAEEAEGIIWRYGRYKGIIIALNPLGVVDVFLSAILDLLMIRALGRLYGLPITSHEAGQLWQNILKNVFGLSVAEIVTMIMFSFAKTTVSLNGLWENPANFTTIIMAGLGQGALGSYGSYVVGKSAQIYFQNGCTWGNFGTDTVIKEILKQAPPTSIISRLRKI